VQTCALPIWSTDLRSQHSILLRISNGRVLCLGGVLRQVHHAGERGSVGRVLQLSPLVVENRHVHRERGRAEQDRDQERENDQCLSARRRVPMSGSLWTWQCIRTRVHLHSYSSAAAGVWSCASAL